MTDPWINPDLWNRAVNEGATTPDILARIDDTLDDWHGGPDAARWTGEPDDSDWPTPRSVIVHFRVDTTNFIDAMTKLAEAMHEIQRSIEASTGKRLVYLLERAQRPRAAADRTNSVCRRAGTRRTKRNARRSA